ncbi:hypothetical protein AB0K12_08125 [Nonomuraea sp. NPDC049419]
MQSEIIHPPPTEAGGATVAALFEAHRLSLVLRRRAVIGRFRGQRETPF